MVASRRTVEGETWRLLPGVALRRDGEAWWAERGHVPMPARFSDLIDVVDRERFVLRGRASDVVNVAGKRASLAGLNAQLLAIPGVVDGAFVVPENDATGVKRLTAFVVAPGLSSRQLLQELRRRVDPAFVPRPLRLVTRLPRNATGKLTAADLGTLTVKRARR
jgi:acyl-coenzyme A synthetase/AMP-(fatty) acid ligase